MQSMLYGDKPTFLRLSIKLRVWKFVKSFIDIVMVFNN